MGNDLSKGKTFTSGETNVDHSDLNNLVDEATIKTTFFTAKDALTAPGTTDVFLCVSGGAFNKIQRQYLFYQWWNLLDLSAITSELTTPLQADLLLVRDTSTGAQKYIQADNLIGASGTPLDESTLAVGDKIPVLDITGTDMTHITPASLKTYFQTGCVLQVLQAVKTAQEIFATTGAWYDVADMSVAITPRDANSKILVRASIYGSIEANSIAGNQVLMWAFRIVRGASTELAKGVCGLDQVQTDDDLVAHDTGHLEKLDSPATADEVTYKVQVWSNAGGASVGNLYINRTDATLGTPSSMITVEELSA